MLTRRTATVTTSAPATSMAFCVSMKSLYLPVPTHRRERNSIPAIVKRSSFMVVALPPADEADDFKPVSIAQRGSGKCLTVHNFEVQLNGDTLGGDAQVGQKGCHRMALRHFPIL